MNKLAIFRHVLEADMANDTRFNPVAGTAFDQQKRQADFDKQTAVYNKRRAQMGLQPLRRRIVPAGDVFSGLERSINNRMQSPAARQQLQESLAAGRQMLGPTGMGVRQVLVEPVQPTGMTGPRTANPNERPFKTVTDAAYKDPRGTVITVSTPNPSVFAHEAGHLQQFLHGPHPATRLDDEAMASRLANKALGQRKPELSAAYGTYVADALGVPSLDPQVSQDPNTRAAIRSAFETQRGSTPVKTRAEQIVANPRNERQRNFAQRVLDRVIARDQPTLSGRTGLNPLLAPQFYGELPPLNPLHEQHIDAAFGRGAARDAYARAEQLRAQNLANPRPEVVAAYRAAGQRPPTPVVPAGQTIIPLARPKAVGLKGFLRGIGR